MSTPTNDQTPPRLGYLDPTGPQPTETGEPPMITIEGEHLPYRSQTYYVLYHERSKRYAMWLTSNQSWLHIKRITKAGQISPTRSTWTHEDGWMTVGTIVYCTAYRPNPRQRPAGLLARVVHDLFTPTHTDVGSWTEAFTLWPKAKHTVPFATTLEWLRTHEGRRDRPPKP